MVASHIIFGAYAHWLPNDERGSGSEIVRSDALREFGPATKVWTRESVANIPYDEQRRREKETVLKYPPVSLSQEQIIQVGSGFAEAVNDSVYMVFACAVMPTHVHLVIAKHKHEPKMIATHFKGKATQHLHWKKLTDDGHLPSNRPPSPWAQKSWCVFWDADEQVRNAIDYVERHYDPPQHWDFVVTYR
jgi:REP element-mobilizing transposase RayT